MSLLDRFLDQAAAHPDRTAIIGADDVSISYGDLARRSARLAGTLARRGIGRDDRVLVAVWPGIDLYTSLAAVWRRGAVAVFPEPAAGISGLRHAVRTARPKALLGGRFIQGLSLALLEAWSIPIRVLPSDLESKDLVDCVDIALSDAALISFTSGTSGVPKAIVRSHGLMLAQHEALAPLIAPTYGPETDLVAFPAFVLTCLGHGITAVMPDWNLRRHDRVDPRAVIQRITRYGVTRALVPPVVTSALAGKCLPKVLRRVMTGGGPVYPDVMRRFLDGSPGTGLTVVYGSTEAEPISHLSVETMDAGQWQVAAGGGGLPAGRPVPEVRVRIIDDEIVVAGTHVVGGYLDPKRDAETKIHENGIVWHRTGDAGRIDAQGDLWLLGRSASVLDGHFPFAVETAARLWPGVRAAAFAAVPSRPLLLVEGDGRDLAEWTRRAADMGGIQVHAVREIIMDRRHRSKPDVAATLSRYVPDWVATPDDRIGEKAA